VTRFADIMAVDTNREAFSSDVGLGGITIIDDDPKNPLPMFIAMDPPKHDHQRKVVARRADATAPILRDWAPWLGLSALFISFGGLSALWAFVSQLAPASASAPRRRRRR
jgi:hypothetical protein